MIFALYFKTVVMCHFVKIYDRKGKLLIVVQKLSSDYSSFIATGLKHLYDFVHSNKNFYPDSSRVTHNFTTVY